MGEVKRTFNPEFINRIDEIIVFDALTDADLIKITRMLVEQMNHNLKEKAITVTISDEAVHLAARAHPEGPQLRRAAAAPGHPAPRRGRPLRGLHPGPGAAGPAHRDRGGRRGASSTGRTSGWERSPHEPGLSARGRLRGQPCVLGRAALQRARLRPGGGPASEEAPAGRPGGDPEQPVPAERDPALLRLHQGRGPLRRAAAQGRLPAALGHGLPRRPHARRSRLARRARS